MRTHKFILPYSSYDTLKLIIRAYSVWGKKGITTDLLSKHTAGTISASTIKHEVVFLASLNLIQQAGLGCYQATSLGIELGSAFEHEQPDIISALWRQVLNGSEYVEEILKPIRFSGIMNARKLKEHILSVTGREGNRHAFNDGAPTVINILLNAQLIAAAGKSGFKLGDSDKRDSLISRQHVERLNSLEVGGWDLSRLRAYCREINDNYQRGNYASVVFVTRALTDYIPPIYGEKNFASVGARTDKKDSFKLTCQNLENSLRNIADYNVHQQAKSSQIPLVKEEINFSQDLNQLIGRTIERLMDLKKANTRSDS